MIIIASLCMMMLVYLAQDFVNRKLPKYRKYPLLISLALVLVYGIIYLVSKSSGILSLAPMVISLVLGTILGLLRK